MILEEKHQNAAKEIVQKHITKKNCNKCYGRGFIGFTTDKTIVPCEKCVDIEKAMEEWKQYVATDEALKEDFKELFEGDTPETGESTESEENAPAEVEVETKEEDHTKKEVVEKKVKTKKETTNAPTKPKNTGVPQKSTVRRSGRRSS
jgi:outer membrane biosynthesis protein TonB